MEAPRTVRAAVVAVALMLALPAAASAARTVESTVVGAQRIVTYTGDDGADEVVITPHEEDGDEYWYEFLVTPAPTGCGATPVRCDANAPNAGGHAELRLIGNGGNDDFDATALPSAGTWPQSGPVYAYGGLGDDTLSGGPNWDRLDGGPGNDVLRPGAGPGVVVGGDGNDSIQNVLGPVQVLGGGGSDSVQFAGAANFNVSLDGIANDPALSNIGADVERISTDSGADVITGSAGHNTIVAGLGNDQIDGRSGSDTIFAAGGNDTVEARDGWVDEVQCGDGTDVARVDFRDRVGDCETVVRKTQDDDNDGVSPPVDCNDQNRFIRPGAGEIPDNGVDEDCSGADARSDADGDGANAASDCNDRDAAIRPGARDKPQNGVDEDCSGTDAPWRPNTARVANNWVAFPRYTRVRELAVRRVPARGKVQVRCSGKRKGCPLKRKNVRVRKHRASLTKLFKKTRLRRGAVIEVRVTAPHTMGRVLRYTIRAGKLPRKRELCLAPGTRRPKRCR